MQKTAFVFIDVWLSNYKNKNIVFMGHPVQSVNFETAYLI